MEARILTAGLRSSALAMLAALLGCFGPAAAVAELQRLEVTAQRTLALPWGEITELEGIAHFALDAAAPGNAAIVDLEHAPRGADGRVHFNADFVLLIPVELPEAPVLLLEVSNRGSRGLVSMFNLAGGGPHATPEEAFGDGFLQRQGLVLGWLGWQYDVPREPGRLALTAPLATAPEGPFRGPLRMDWVVDEPTERLPLGHRGMRGYAPAEPASPRNVLTRRAGRDEPAELVARARWQFSAAVPGGAIDAITMAGGFEPGWIYELVWLAEDPPVAGVGLAALRDFVSHLRHDPDSLVRPTHTLAVGVSQSGRLLRHFLYEGFNLDLQGRRVFDGMLVVVAGAGRGSFNHRFAQPSLDGHRYSAFKHPVDLYPFASLPVPDPLGDRPRGLLDAYADLDGAPRLMQVNTGYEYYSRAASLLHHDAEGRHDIALAATERLYHIAAGQHFSQPQASLRPAHGGAVGLLAGNAIDWRLNLRALLRGLVDWVTDEVPPPDSRVPMLTDETLVPIEALQLPRVAGLVAPRAPHQARRLDFGPRFERGIIDHQPPRAGFAFAARVPQLDALGNECCGIRNVELTVPLATHLPWSLRTGRANADELADFLGSTLPLAASTVQRAPGDTRPTIDSLYAGREDFLQRTGVALDALIGEGFVLAEDRARSIEDAALRWQIWADAPLEGAHGNE